MECFFRTLHKTDKMVTAILLVDSTDSLPYIGRGPGGKELPVAPAASQQGAEPSVGQPTRGRILPQDQGERCSGEWAEQAVPRAEHARLANTDKDTPCHWQ